MQDRICQVDETSCNARPDHTFGSFAPICPRILDVRYGPSCRRAGYFAFRPTSRPTTIAAAGLKLETGPKAVKKPGAA
jgi:hypothetical protein